MGCDVILEGGWVGFCEAILFPCIVCLGEEISVDIVELKWIRSRWFTGGELVCWIV